jgi:hypothetical protein
MAEAQTNQTEKDYTLETTSSSTFDVQVDIKQVVDARKAQRLAQLLFSGEMEDSETTSSGSA